MMIADKTHVTYSCPRDTKKCGIAEDDMKSVKYKGNYYWMWEGGIEKDGTDERFAMVILLDKAGVFYYADYNHHTLTVRNFRRTPKNTVIALSTCDNDGARVELGLMVAALKYHQWDLPTLFEKSQQIPAQYLIYLHTITSLTQRLENLTDDDTQYDFN